MNEPLPAAAPAVTLRAISRRVVQIAFSIAVWAAIALLAAGTWRWPRLWLCLGFTSALLVVNFIAVASVNPRVIVERSQRHAGTKRFDLRITFFYGLALLLSPLVAGFDVVRFGWAPLPAWTLWPGLLLLALGNIPVTWAMRVNPFLERTVRIQTERDHRPVEAGPYRWVRHPMYVGILLQQIGAPLALGSSWAFAVLVVVAALLVARTALEDRTLRGELPGYAEYAQRTRYRLLPGLW